MMRLYLLIPFLFLQTHRPQLQLARDLKKDKEIIESGHRKYNRHIDFRKFEPYARLDLSAFKFDEYKVGNNAIKKWVSTGVKRLVVYEISTKKSVDTVVYEQAIPVDVSAREMQKQRADTVRIKKNIMLRSYVIQPHNSKQLVYITGEDMGLRKYYIGDKYYTAVYEVLEVGAYPDINELKKLLR